MAISQITAASISSNAITTIKIADANVTTAKVNLTSGVSTFAAGSNTNPAITTTGDTNTGIFFPAADTIAFAEGGAEAMRIDSNGNVGIGTVSPTTQLSLSQGGNGNNLNVLSRTHLGGTYSSNSLILGYSVKADTTANDRMIGTETNSGGGAPAAILMNSGVMQFHTATSVTSGSAFSSERMRIFSSGGVSIGNITDPGATNLSVTGSNYVGVARYAPPQVTANVSTSATDILVVVASVNICWVLGTSGANYFLDLISVRAGGEVVVLQSYTLLGSPAARTYAIPVANARLTMASSTYRVTVTPLGLPVS